MKTKLLLLTFLAMLAFTACEEETTSDDNGNNTEKTYLLSKYKITSSLGTMTKTFTYNDDNKVIKISVNGYSGGVSVTDIVYDSQGRVSEVYVDDKLKDEYEYQTGKIINNSRYNDTEYWDKTTYTVNTDGKVIKSQMEGSDSYHTYNWENGNYTFYTWYHSQGTSSVTYQYDLDVKNPAYDQYLFQHPMYENKNIKKKTIFETGDPSTYTIESNDGGYVTRITENNEYLGLVTQTYTYL